MFRAELLSELAKFEIPLRDDSNLCKRFIEEGPASGLSSHAIARKMAEMKYLFEYTDYRSIKDSLKKAEEDKRWESLSGGFSKIAPFPMREIKEEVITCVGYMMLFFICILHYSLKAQRIALADNGHSSFPVIFPWIQEKAKAREQQLKDELHKVGLKLRSDSKLCSDFIMYGESNGWSMNKIVQRMSEVLSIFFPFCVS